MILKFTLQRSATPMLFKNYSLVKVIYLPIRLSKTCAFNETLKHEEH